MCSLITENISAACTKKNNLYQDFMRSFIIVLIAFSIYRTRYVTILVMNLDIYQTMEVKVRQFYSKRNRVRTIDGETKHISDFATFVLELLLYVCS